MVASSVQLAVAVICECHVCRFVGTDEERAAVGGVEAR